MIEIYLIVPTMEKFYLTTAINYTNGPPHIGHAYEAIVADCLSRYHRISGKEVFFLTGSDEHGQKIADTAASLGITPQRLCDRHVAEFQSLNQQLAISNDGYIRTTSDTHKELAQLIWTKVADNDDIYLGNYQGWYSKREERFLTETEAKEMNYLDGDKPLIRTSESSYFFRLSKYQQQIIDHLNDHPEFIFPPEKRTEILERLKQPLLDLSISRTSFDWGIPIPDRFQGRVDDGRQHVFYVWFDALTNYLSGIDWPDDHWPADLQLIGKDIIWFHAVIWPAMLLSAGIPLPKRIVCHGFVNGPDDRKMSKTWGNVVDPIELLQRYPSDSLRYFVLRECSFGQDFSFSESSLIARHNNELAATFGNLVSRVLNLTEKYSQGRIPDAESIPIFDLVALVKQIDRCFNTQEIEKVLQEVFSKLTLLNKWLTEQAPWSSRQEDRTEEQRQRMIRTLLEGVYILAHFLEPFIPTAIAELFSRLGRKSTTIPLLSWSNLEAGGAIVVGESLFPRIRKE